jgi:hypothetical protein
MVNRESSMSESRPRATRDDVEEAIREIRAYYQHGRAILRQVPARGGYHRGEIVDLARRLGWNETKARKARQFAGQYTREQLADLCRLLREHRPHFGPAHVGVLVTVPDARQRADLQRWCIEHDISKAELELEVKKRFGRRRFGGRRRQVAQDPLHALVQVDEMADTWLRWHAVAAEEEEHNGHGQSVLERLPDVVRQQVRAVSRAMRRLRDTIAPGLEEARSGQRRARRRS